VKHFSRWALGLLLPLSGVCACPPLSPEQAGLLAYDAALERAGQCHPDVRAAERAQQAAQADLTTASEGQNPQLTVGAGSVNPSRGGVGSGPLWNKTFDHQLRVDQLIERGGKPALRRAAAEALHEAALQDLADARRQARLAVAHAYVDLAAALARQAQTQASAALNEAALQALRRRVQAGDAAALDATRFELDSLRLQADLMQAEAELRGLRQQLAQALGAPEAAPWLAPSLPVVEAPTAADGIAHRPDVLAAAARRQAAGQAHALAVAQRTRDVSVGVQFDRYPASLGNPSGTGNTVSVSLAVPLFLRHAYEGEIAHAQADADAAEDRLQRARQTAEADLLRAQAQWQAADARRRLAVERLLPAAERVAEGAELAYRRGATSALDVLDARRALRTAHIERINAEADRAKAAAELEAAAPSRDLSVSP
jgi:cobalt-zinc-cadmium efflux system outer membrane protein